MTTLPILPAGAEHILVASPNSVIRQQLLDNLSRKARRVEQASGGAEALLHLEKGFWQVLFLDRQLPDLDAEELRQTVRERFPTVEVVIVEDGATMLTGGGEPAENIQVASSRAHDRDERAEIDDEADCLTTCGSIGASTPNSAGRRKPGGTVRSSCITGMVGSSKVMRSVHRMTHLVAPRETTVLITGPTGSGKELVARALHEISPRAPRTFAVVNCAAIPETMLEAELFGYSRGAFTGAQQSYAGRIQAAHMGTLFLDEIGDMPLSLQPKLLRFLEQKEVQRLGSSQMVRVDARVVAATNADLLELVSEGKFREDLYYRLSAFPIAIPPLREREDDVAEMASFFLEKFASMSPAPVLSDEATALLRSHNWPGNVRELQNVMERALILAEGEAVISRRHLMLPELDLRMRCRPAIGRIHSPVT